MIFVLGIALFIGGFVTSIYTWPQVREWINGEETEIRALEDKIKTIKARLF